jgi:RNA polymerase sigma factor (sigma-70 family)
LLQEIQSPTTSFEVSSTRSREHGPTWQEIYEEHVDAVFRLVRCLGVPEKDAEDVIQRVFLVVHRKAKDLDKIVHVRAWLRAITVRVVADHRAWHRVRELKAALLRATFLAAASPIRTPEQSLDETRVQRRVHEVLARMSGKLRDVLVLTELEECKPSEVAELLGIPVNTVRSRRGLARTEFARLWQRGDSDEPLGPNRPREGAGSDE